MQQHILSLKTTFWANAMRFGSLEGSGSQLCCRCWTCATDERWTWASHAAEVDIDRVNLSTLGVKIVVWL